MWLFNDSTSQNKGQIYIFEPSGNTTNWVTWEKPKGCIYLNIVAIGGGGGGGNGTNFSGTSGVTAIGGQGGGCSCVSKLYVPAFLVPDILAIRVGTGGNAGQNGTDSMVAIKPNTASSLTFRDYNLLYSAGGTGGSPGLASPLAAASAAVTSNMAFANLGIYGSDVGTTSGGGGNGAAGTNVFPYNGYLLTGGAGGAGGVSGTSAFSGGNVGPTASTLMFPTLTGGNTSGAPNGSSAPKMIFNDQYGLVGLPGAGGASVISGVGGNGGAGSLGNGGGGGGSGITGGTGGRGGDGIVIIQAF